MPLIPFVKNGYYGSQTWVPLVNGNGLTAGGGEPIPEIVWVKVSGTSPLSLPDAIANSIKSLTQFGKCATVDGEIYCNNGKLVAVDDELPAAYKRVLGFQCNNNAMWQIAGFKMRGSDTLRFSFKCTMNPPACNVLGAYDGTSAETNYSLYIGSTSSAKYLRYNGSSYRSDADSNEQYDVVIMPTGSSGMKTDSKWTAKTFESTNDLYIGTTSLTATSSKLVGEIIGEIIVDGRLRLIPCERVSDSVLGYYDTYSETFYEPYTGFGGAVSLGYDGSHYTLQTVGTPEVLTIGTQTATVANLFSTGTVHDEQDIISGTLTRKTEVSVSDGVITISALSTPVTQTVPRQPLTTSEGTNTVSVTSNVDPVELEVEYANGYE